MNTTEVKKALALLQECYPHFMDGREIQSTVAIWGRMFPDESYGKVEAAIMAFVASDTKGFPPAIGQIKEKLAQMDADNELDEAKAWALVYAAMCKGATQKEFDKLPPEVQCAVGTRRILFDWSMMDLETVNSVVASNFMRSYRARATYVREVKKLPPEARRLYAAVGDAFAMDRALPEPVNVKPKQEPQACQMPENVRRQLEDFGSRHRVDERQETINQLNSALGKLETILGGGKDG